MFGLRAARLFDGREMGAHPVVTVDDAAIIAVGCDLPPDIELEDLGDVTLMLGLIDTHQHLCFDGSGPLEEQVAGVSYDELLARARANDKRALQAGLTAIRDLGDRHFVTLPVRDEPGLPTILASGPPLTKAAGHCWYLGGGCGGRGGLGAGGRGGDR